jgi:hypothetical protein
MLMHLEFLYVFVASFPVIAMSLVAIAVIASRLKQLIWKEKKPQGRRRRVRISVRDAAMGLAFLPLSLIYRPSLSELVKAQIRQVEDVDEDENGDPQSPTMHLLRQLRRIRRGDRVETLYFSLE